MSDVPSLFLGKPPAYWLELEKQAKALHYDRLIAEIALLRAKVSFYESRIEEMSKFGRGHVSFLLEDYK